MEGFDATSFGLYSDPYEDTGEVGEMGVLDSDFERCLFRALCNSATFTQLHRLALNTSGSLAMV